MYITYYVLCTQLILSGNKQNVIGVCVLIIMISLSPLQDDDDDDR